MGLLLSETHGYVKDIVDEALKAMLSNKSLVHRVAETKRYLMLKCQEDPGINAEHVGMNRDMMKPLAKAYARCKDVATVPVLKVVLKELTTQIGVSTSAQPLDFDWQARPFGSIWCKARVVSCTQEKYEARQRSKPGWQDQKPAILHMKAVLLAKLKLKKFAARAEQARSTSSGRETLEISDDEAVAPIPPPEAPAVAEAAKVGDPVIEAAPGELLTRTQQLNLANSKKRKNKNKDKEAEEVSEDIAKDASKPLLKKCLSWCSLAIARKRSWKAKPSKKQAKPKAKAKSCPKPKASAKAKAAAAKPRPKAKAKAEVRLPNITEIRKYHGLVKKFKQAREGVFYGDIPKEDRGVLKEKIH
ncbi:nipblb, partial [Symbiodinium sp. KB8]